MDLNDGSKLDDGTFTFNNGVYEYNGNNKENSDVLLAKCGGDVALYGAGKEAVHQVVVNCFPRYVFVDCSCNR